MNLAATLIDLSPTEAVKRMIRRGVLGVNKLSSRHIANISKGEVIIHSGVWRTETMENLAKRAGPKGKVIVIEGDPTNYKILEIERKRRFLDNVIVVERALWSEESTVTMRSSEHSDFNALNDADTYSDIDDRTTYEEVSMRASSLDDILAEIGVDHVDHVSLTVSGAELMALKGASKLLKQPGLRIFIRSILLKKDDSAPIYPDVVAYLKEQGLNVWVGPPIRSKDIAGRNLYAYRD